jgi:ABC-type transport system involved in Fe-S cluster assembly fused permease/ATPase subunit
VTASFLLTSRVIRGQTSVADVSSFWSYWFQLQQPLNNLGYSYRNIHNSFIDSERVLKLLMKKPSITDKIGAKALVVTDGEIKFEHVDFSYDIRRKTLTDLTFCAAPGKTVALVGESGSGKSTVQRLLLRFFDVNPPGIIYIDGQGIGDVTIWSLRNSIGIVPQVYISSENLMLGNRFIQRHNHV